MASNAPLGVATVVNVAKTLVNFCTIKDEEKVKDITATEELVRGLTFDKFKEKISCKIIRGVFVKDFGTVMENLAARFNIPDDSKSSLLEGLISTEDKKEMTHEFKFTEGKEGDYTFGRIATVRYGQKIDMAYSVYFLDFKISPKVIEHPKAKKFLSFTIGKPDVWHVTEERNLSKFEMYSRKKAIQGFKDELTRWDD